MTTIEQMDAYQDSIRTAFDSWLDVNRKDVLAAIAGASEVNRDLLAACEAVLACPTEHDLSGRAYIKVPARSLNDVGAMISAAIAKATATT